MSTRPEVPPYLCDEGAEQELLGCLLVDIELRRTGRKILRPDDFYVHHHRVIYEAIQCSGDAEFFKIATALATDPIVHEAGGERFVRNLAVLVDDYSRGLQFAQAVAQLGRRRRILKLAEDVARVAFAGKLDRLPIWINKRLKDALKGPVNLAGAGQQMRLPGVLAASASEDRLAGVVGRAVQD